MFAILAADHRAKGEPNYHLERKPGIWTANQRVPIKPGGMEEESQLQQEESCRNGVQRDKTEERGLSKFMGSHAAAERVADPSGPTWHRTTELLRVCRAVNYLTGPVV